MRRALITIISFVSVAYLAPTPTFAHQPLSTPHTLNSLLEDTTSNHQALYDRFLQWLVTTNRFDLNTTSLEVAASSDHAVNTAPIAPLQQLWHAHISTRWLLNLVDDDRDIVLRALQHTFQGDRAVHVRLLLATIAISLLRDDLFLHDNIYHALLERPLLGDSQLWHALIWLARAHDAANHCSVDHLSLAQALRRARKPAFLNAHYAAAVAHLERAAKLCASTRTEKPAAMPIAIVWPVHLNASSDWPVLDPETLVAWMHSDDRALQQVGAALLMMTDCPQHPWCSNAEIMLYHCRAFVIAPTPQNTTQPCMSLLTQYPARWQEIWWHAHRISAAPLAQSVDYAFVSPDIVQFWQDTLVLFQSGWDWIAHAAWASYLQTHRLRYVEYVWLMRAARQTQWWGLLNLAAHFARARGHRTPETQALAYIVPPCALPHILNTASTAVPPSVLIAIGRQESLWGLFAFSSAQARGVWQLMPFWADNPHQAYRLLEPATNLAIAHQLLASLFQRYHHKKTETLARALAAYNAGTSIADQWDNAANIASQALPAETQLFVHHVSHAVQHYQRLNRHRMFAEQLVPLVARACACPKAP